MTIAVPERSSQRISLFDGLRGVALVLVVLSHLWVISPWIILRKNDATDGTGTGLERLAGYLLGAGNYAVSIFFVVGTFLVTRAMIRQTTSPTGLMPGVNLLRRFVRLSGQLYFFLLVFFVYASIEDSSVDGDAIGTSVLTAATYTWNWYVHDNVESGRADIGHLWYLAVDFQMFLIVLALVWLLRRRPGWLVVALVGLWVALAFFRAETYDFDPFWALLRTWARGDAPVAGAIAAAALPYLGRWQHWGRTGTVVGVAALVPLLFWCNGLDGYFGPAGLLLDAALVTIVVGATLAPPPRWLVTVVGSRPLTFLGRHSLSVFLWHLPMIYLVARHTDDWREPVRIGLALLLTVAGATVSELLVERRVQRFLDSPRWRETDHGLLRFVVGWLDRRLSRDTPSTPGPDPTDRDARYPGQDAQV